MLATRRKETAMEYLPNVYQHLERAFPHVHSAHQELAKACYEGGPLDKRAARLVKLGIALGAQAEGAVRSHARRALSEGESREEVRHVGLLALTTIGFPHTIAGLSWIERGDRNREMTRRGRLGGPSPERPLSEHASGGKRAR
jgi:4-carboxymuconolactone decarboxylase